MPLIQHIRADWRFYAPTLVLAGYTWIVPRFLSETPNNWLPYVRYNHEFGTLYVAIAQQDTAGFAIKEHWIEPHDPFGDDDQPLVITPDTAHETAELLLQLCAALGPPLHSAQFCAE